MPRRSACSAVDTAQESSRTVLVRCRRTGLRAPSCSKFAEIRDGMRSQSRLMQSSGSSRTVCVSSFHATPRGRARAVRESGGAEEPVQVVVVTGGEAGEEVVDRERVMHPVGAEEARAARPRSQRRAVARARGSCPVRAPTRVVVDLGRRQAMTSAHSQKCVPSRRHWSIDEPSRQRPSQRGMICGSVSVIAGTSSIRTRACV